MIVQSVCLVKIRLQLFFVFHLLDLFMIAHGGSVAEVDVRQEVLHVGTLLSVGAEYELTE